MADIAALERRIAWLEKLVENRFPNTVATHRVWIVEMAQALVCEQLHIQPSHLISQRRFGRLAWARHVAMALSYESSGLSTPRVAELFNRKDHGTVLHAVKHVRLAERLYPVKRAEVQTLRKRFRIIIGKCRQART